MKICIENAFTCKSVNQAPQCQLVDIDLCNIKKSYNLNFSFAIKGNRKITGKILKEFWSEHKQSFSVIECMFENGAFK